MFKNLFELSAFERFKAKSPHERKAQANAYGLTLDSQPSQTHLNQEPDTIVVDTERLYYFERQEVRDLSI